MKSKKCTGCHADIYWVKTINGKSMPVNTKKETIVVYDPESAAYKVISGYTPHWATCPAADKFRKKKKSGRNFTDYIQNGQ